LFAVLMCLLYFVGVFAAYLLVLKREGKKFPWSKVLLITCLSLVLIAAITFFVLLKLHYHPIGHWPFFAK
jgi:sec-independent protein translocase protein TatC